jgi:hypothetical protein
MHNYDKPLNLKIIHHGTQTAFRAQFIHQQEYRVGDDERKMNGEYALMVSPSMLGKTFPNEGGNDDVHTLPNELTEHVGFAIIEGEGDLVKKQKGLEHTLGDVDFSDTYENIQPSDNIEEIAGLTIKVNNPDDFGKSQDNSFYVISTIAESMNVDNDEIQADTPYILTSDPIVAEAIINTFRTLSSKEVVMDSVENDLVKRAKRPADVLFLEATLTDQAETYGIDPSNIKNLTESALTGIPSLTKIQKLQIIDQSTRSPDIASLGRKIAIMPGAATGLSHGPVQKVVNQQAARYKHVLPAGKNVLSHASTPLVNADSTLKKNTVNVRINGETKEGILYQAETEVYFPTPGSTLKNIGIAIDDGYGGNTWIAGPDDRVLESYIEPVEAPAPKVKDAPSISQRIR